MQHAIISTDGNATGTAMVTRVAILEGNETWQGVVLARRTYIDGSGVHNIAEQTAAVAVSPAMSARVTVISPQVIQHWAVIGSRAGRCTRCCCRVQLAALHGIQLIPQESDLGIGSAVGIAVGVGKDVSPVVFFLPVCIVAATALLKGRARHPAPAGSSPATATGRAGQGGIVRPRPGIGIEPAPGIDLILHQVTLPAAVPEQGTVRQGTVSNRRFTQRIFPQGGHSLRGRYELPGEGRRGGQ